MTDLLTITPKSSSTPKKKQRKIRKEWPHVLMIDSGWTHPTAATMTTVSPDGHYFSTRFYVQPGKYVDYHAKQLLRIAGECGQLGRRTFFSLMTDDRDPMFIQGMIKYTGGQISPGILQCPPGWKDKYFKNAMLGKLEGLKKAKPKKFSVNKLDPYYQEARAEWGGIIWGDEVPVKDKDDIHDTLIGGIWVLHPQRIRDLDFRETETRELPIDMIIAERERREKVLIEHTLTRL